MDVIKGNSVLDVFFAEDTMSVHFKENNQIFKKNGKPWARESTHEDKTVTHGELTQLIDQLFKEVEQKDDGFLEIDKPLSKVMQIGPYRIVIVYPPLSDGLEMTVVKPIKRLTLEDYNLDDKILDMLQHQSKGILVSGSPGSWKTTFAQAVVDMYVDMNKVIKTLESPRDLMVPNDVVQYSFSYGSHNELRDILLLSRPDFTVYDEVRNNEDFQLYKDLRLTGIGLLWVIHATRAVDGIQRFIGVIELGIIPQVIDTVIYIKNGAIDQIYTLALKVKVPSWMNSEDLSRPVIEVTNFATGELEYEIYTYGEQVVVIPLKDIESWSFSDQDKSLHYATLYLQDYFNTMMGFPTLVHMKSAWSLTVYLEASNKGSIIGKGGEKIAALEKKLGVSIQVKPYDDMPFLTMNPDIEVGKKRSYMTVSLPSSFAGQTVSVLVGKKLLTLHCGPDATFTLTKKQIIRDVENKGIRIVDHRQL